jgi:hypothetical protein
VRTTTTTPTKIRASNLHYALVPAQELKEQRVQSGLSRYPLTPRRAVKILLLGDLLVWPHVVLLLADLDLPSTGLLPRVRQSRNSAGGQRTGTNVKLSR